MRLNPFSWFSKNRKVDEEDYDKQLSRAIKSFETQFGINLRPKIFAGENVTVDTAMGLDTAYACIRDKSESIGQLPVVVKRNGVVLKRGNREHKIFAEKPNDYMTTQDLIEFIVMTLETTGNCYILPVKNRYGNISELVPLRYQNSIITQMDANGRVYHTYSTNDGKPNIEFAGETLIHIKLNSLGGVRGLSPITVTAMAHGVAISQEQYLGGLMTSSAMPKGILYTDQIFKDDTALNRVKNQWTETFGGARNSGKTPLLENNLKYQSISISPADSELIKQRLFSKVQICGIYRVPPSRVGVLEAQKYSNLEDNNRAYLRDSLVPLIVKIESAINNILPPTLSIKIDTKHFARGDRVSQVTALKDEFTMGSISINEMRADLDRDEIEGGQFHAINTNNITLGLLTDAPKIQAEMRQASKPNNESTEDQEDDAE